MTAYTTRPITTWPGTRTGPRQHSRFKTSYGATEDLLFRELHHLRARDVVLEIDIQPWDLRLDGSLRANAKPQGPRVCLYFTGKHGAMTMPCDTYWDWRDNIRAIALTLEALRACERYGATLTGEQYRGWTALPATTSVTTRVQAAWQLLADTASMGLPAEGIRTRAILDVLFRDAARIAHPDAGGSDERMAAVNRARETILLAMDGGA